MKEGGKLNKREIFFNLIRQQICGGELNEEIKEGIDTDTIKVLHETAKRYDISSIVSSAILSNGLSSDAELSSILNNERMLSVMRYRQMEYEIESISRTFEEAKIPYIPLKGALIRNLYPEKWMRTSCDIDILIKEDDVDRAIGVLCDGLSYKTDGQKAYHDVSLFSESGIHLELHFSILENKENIDKLLSNVWSYASPESEGGYRYVLTSEFLIFHVLAHTSYHFLCGGCGIRSIIDFYLLKTKLQYDNEKLSELCTESSIDKFRTSLEKLSLVWFEGKEHDELTKDIEEYVLNGGIYGDVETKTIVNREKNGGKFKYLFKRIFLPYRALCIRYPKLKNRRLLTPFYQAKRWFDVLFGANSNGAVIEISTILSSDKEKSKKVIELIDSVGLMN